MEIQPAKFTKNILSEINGLYASRRNISKRKCSLIHLVDAHLTIIVDSNSDYVCQKIIEFSYIIKRILFSNLRQTQEKVKEKFHEELSDMAGKILATENLGFLTGAGVIGKDVKDSQPIVRAPADNVPNRSHGDSNLQLAENNGSVQQEFSWLARLL